MFKILQEAGWPIYPLILCSIIALAVIVERFTALRQVRVAPGYLLGEVIAVTRNGLPAADVVAKLQDNSLLGYVLAAGLKLLAVDPRAGETALRQTFEGAGRDAAHKLDRYLNTLGTIAAAAPLLGLFGTVIGMIEIFGSQGASVGNTNPAELAHGISTALYNTAAGLLVAIPSLMFYRYFRGRVDDYLHTLEQSSEQLLTQLVRLNGRNPGPEMNFRKPRPEDPEINLIPFIDVLLVILIFLMLSTTYSKFTELQVTLPSADADASRDRPAEIIVSVSSDGRYTIDHQPVEGRNVDALTAALQAAGSTRKDPFLIISADAMSTHQAVVNVLDAARRAGMSRMTFAAQAGTGAAAAGAQ